MKNHFFFKQKKSNFARTIKSNEMKENKNAGKKYACNSLSKRIILMVKFLCSQFRTGNITIRIHRKCTVDAHISLGNALKSSHKNS